MKCMKTNEDQWQSHRRVQGSGVQAAILIMNAVQGRSAAVSAGLAAARSKECSARASRLVFGSSDALRLVLGAHIRAPGTRQRAIMRIAEVQGSRVQGPGFE